MQYIKRAIEPYLEKARKTFKSVLIMGPRQVGKSTLLKHSLPDIPLITFDDKMLLRAAQNDPTLFLKDNTPPLMFLTVIKLKKEEKVVLSVFQIILCILKRTYWLYRLNIFSVLSLKMMHNLFHLLV